MWNPLQEVEKLRSWEAEMKICHTLKRVVVKNEVDVDMKAIKEAKWANELKVEVEI